MTVVTASDPRVQAVLGPAQYHPVCGALAPKEISHRKTEDNKSCLVLVLPVPTLFIGKAKLFLCQPASMKEMADSSLATSLYVGRGHRGSCWEKHVQLLNGE